jgi:hypothetical protein
MLGLDGATPELLDRRLEENKLPSCLKRGTGYGQPEWTH